MAETAYAPLPKFERERLETPQGKRWWVRLHEKGGKRHEMPAHHTLEPYLDAYIDAAGIRGDG
jgi:hypothetical protein